MSKENQMLRLGPFTGGMNNYSNPAFILDDEVVDMQNLEVGFDRVLRSRPPIVEIGQGSSIRALSDFNIVGSGVFQGDPGVEERLMALLVGSRLLFSNVAEITANQIAYMDVTYDALNLQTGWRAVNNTVNINCAVAVPYQGEFWFVPDSYITPAVDNATYYHWNPGDPNSSAVAGTSGPKGNTGVIFKDRLFVAKGNKDPGVINGSRLYFSEPGDLDNFLGTSFIDVGLGDGSNIMALVVYQDTVVIFKERSTWQFSYDADPADGVLRVVSETIGTDNYKATAQHENSLFVYQGNSVYEVVNFQYIKINARVPFERGREYPEGFGYDFAEDRRHLSIVGDRLVCRHFGNTYVYNLRTRAWSRWETYDDGDTGSFGTTDVNWFSDWWLSPVKDNNGNSVYYAVLGLKPLPRGNQRAFRIKDGYSHDDVEAFDPFSHPPPYPIECKLVTKKYDLGRSFARKKLLWWGINMAVGRTEIFQGKPLEVKITYSIDGQPKTWNEIKSMTWDALDGTMFWHQFEDVSQAQVMDIKDISTEAQKGFIRFGEPILSSWYQFHLEASSTGRIDDLLLISDIVVSAEEAQVAPVKVT